MTATVEQILAHQANLRPRPHPALHRPYAHRKPPAQNTVRAECVVYTADCPCGACGDVRWEETRWELLDHRGRPQAHGELPAPTYEIACTQPAETVESS